MLLTWNFHQWEILTNDDDLQNFRPECQIWCKNELADWLGIFRLKCVYLLNYIKIYWRKSFQGNIWSNSANKYILNKRYQASRLIHSYSQFYILVCKIPTKQVAELKICKWSSFVNICHWWKFQVHSTCQSWDPRGGLTCPSRCFAYKKIGRCSKG